MIENDLIKILTPIKPIYLTYDGYLPSQILKLDHMAFRLLTFALIISLSLSCKTQKVNTPDSFEGSMITFGNEGGFAGSTSENYIFEDGQIQHFESRRGTTVNFGVIDKDVVGQIFENYKTLGLDKISLNDPGNLSYYIKMKMGDEEKVIRWGGMNEETPPIVKQYFKTLGQIAKKYKTVTE